MKRIFEWALLAAVTAAICLAMARADGPDARKVRIVLERLQNNSWSAVDPGLVLAQGDRVRFKINTDFDGYLYVVNYGTSGKYSVLFPAKDTGTDNKISKGHSQQIPAADSVFRIVGPAGQEIVYWMLSPIPVPGDGSIPVPEKPKTPAVLIPRCDDSLMRARGECIDSSAGVRDLASPAPEELEPAGKPAGLTFLREDKNSVVAANASSGPIVYEFRISHK